MLFLMLLFALVVILPVVISAALYFCSERITDWRTADRSSAGLLPQAQLHPEAMVRIFSARTIRWRGIVATHSWIVIKARGARAYSRFDYTAWGEPLWVDRFVPDGRWFGRKPEVVFAADGEAAERMIPHIREAVRGFPFANAGDYRPWPGPNSNTFVTAVMSSVPGMRATLPPTAIGKDFPFDGRWAGLSPSHTGIRFSIGGYAGVTVGWIEGIEFNLLGAVAGIDIRRPALKVPALGRLGWRTQGSYAGMTAKAGGQKAIHAIGIDRVPE